MALGILIVGLVQSANHYHAVGLASLLHSLGEQHFGRTALGDRAANGHSVVALHRVAHVATRIVNLYLRVYLSQTVADAVERKYLFLHLERRRATAHGHHLDGVLANHEHLLQLAGIERQQLAALGLVVLQEHDALAGNLSGCIVVGL